MLYAVVVLKARNVPLNKQPKQSYQKTRLPKNDKRKGRMLEKLNASQSCFCSDCNSSSRVLTCGVGNYSRHVRCLRAAEEKTKICSKTKNHWLDLMVSSLHCTTTESSFNDFVKNGRAHKLNIKPKNLRMKGSSFLSLSCDDLSCSCSLNETNPLTKAKSSKTCQVTQRAPKQSRVGYVAT